MASFEWLIISKSSDFLTMLKNSQKILKNIKFSLHRDIHMKIILYGSDRSFELWKRRTDP
jgi:hypothetical protein